MIDILLNVQNSIDGTTVKFVRPIELKSENTTIQQHLFGVNVRQMEWRKKGNKMLWQ